MFQPETNQLTMYGLITEIQVIVSLKANLTLKYW